ncbi:MAG: hypothetical protein KF724_10140 [Phycisphaeraceae bacterium]|nr:hypothetical protein [Phycisphaeraceae bacterium]
MEPVRIGERLVRQGTISEEQLRAALERQDDTGQPLGLVCEQMFGVDPRVVEAAWAEQYAELVADLAPRLRSFDPECVRLVSRRQAWQFAVLPLRYEDDTLVVATVAERLAQARRFMASVVPGAVTLVVTDPKSLARALARHHPFPGMDESVLVHRRAA